VRGFKLFSRDQELENEEQQDKAREAKLEMEQQDQKLEEQHAGVTQLVECHLAKVDVESSNLFSRSR
jgi:hypothetical protein